MATVYDLSTERQMYVDTKWPPDPLLKLVCAPTPELIMLPRNPATAAAWSLQTVYDLAAKMRIGLRFSCKNLTSKCASLRFTCNRQLVSRTKRGSVSVGPWFPYSKAGEGTTCLQVSEFWIVQSIAKKLRVTQSVVTESSLHSC